MTNESIWEKVDSIEKRFENRLDKSNLKFNTLNPVWDNEKEDALNVFEMIDELNYLNNCCDNLIEDNTEYVAEMNQMHKENEQLKQSNNGAIELMLDGIVEMHDGKRDYAESIFNKAIKLLKGDVE